jgi:DNA polymerase III epsilon subunit-like protein
MRTLTFDTETTGLPRTKLLTPEAVDLWPHVLQLSYVIYDDSTNTIINIHDSIINIPENIDISQECTNIHGITREMSSQSDKTMQDVLDVFIEDFDNSDLIVGHNLSFDLNMLKIEIMRQLLKAGLKEREKYLRFLEDLKKTNKNYCTMQKSIVICDIKAVDRSGKEYTKFPKLSELYEKLFQRKPKNLHNSLNDVLICLRCYYMLEHKKDLLRTNRELRYLFRELQL